MNKLKTLWLELCLYTRVLKQAVNPYAGDITPTGRLFATKIDVEGNRFDMGLVSTKVVTTAGVNFLVTGLNSTVALDIFKYHGTGTSSTAEAVGNTDLGVSVETRATGTQTVGASNNIYRTVGLVAYTATRAITEHGIFSAVTGGTLLDRSVFAAINVINGDSIEFTYELTLPAGS